MTGINSYSTTAASNVQANTGINWDEGMSPAAVNNSARQNMADTRAAFNDLIWFKYGKGDLDYSPVYVASTQFKIAGADVTTPYHIGRRVKAVGSGTGTIYGTITNTAFSTDTTVTVSWDSGSLSNETLTIYLSQAPATGAPVPIAGVETYSTGTFTPTDQSGASLSLTVSRARYTRIGTMVFVELTFAYPSTADTSASVIGLGALPNCANVTGVSGAWTIYFGGAVFLTGYMTPNTNKFAIFDSAGSAQHNNGLSTSTLRMQFHYETA